MVELLIRGGFCLPTSLNAGLVCRDPLRTVCAWQRTQIGGSLALSKAYRRPDFRGLKTIGHD